MQGHSDIFNCINIKHYITEMNIKMHDLSFSVVCGQQCRNG